MYILSINAENTVTDCLFVDEAIDLNGGQVEVSWADYLTVLSKPNLPFKYENNNLIKLEAPSVYHIWENFQWAIDEANLTSIRQNIWENIKKLRDARLENGGYPVGTYWFHSDIYAQSNYTDLLMMGSQIPLNTYWKTMSGVFVTMTQVLAQQILAAKALQKSRTFAKSEQHKAAMLASEDPLNYDFTTSWPPIYGE